MVMMLWFNKMVRYYKWLIFIKTHSLQEQLLHAVAVYTAPTNGRGIVQNIQVTSQGGSKIVQAKINDSSNSNTSNLIAYASISGPTICNIAKGPIILEENDALTLETNVYYKCNCCVLNTRNI
jgi:hypothetical protein